MLRATDGRSYVAFALLVDAARDGQAISHTDLGSGTKRLAVRIPFCPYDCGLCFAPGHPSTFVCVAVQEYIGARSPLDHIYNYSVRRPVNASVWRNFHHVEQASQFCLIPQACVFVLHPESQSAVCALQLAASFAYATASCDDIGIYQSFPAQARANLRCACVPHFLRMHGHAPHPPKNATSGATGCQSARRLVFGHG